MSVKQSGEGITGTRVATGFTFGYDAKDYGGTFTNYTAPSAEGDLELRLVVDTNGGTNEYRFYIWQKEANAWHYVTLTA